jgi:predicted transcriptional regulator
MPNKDDKPELEDALQRLGAKRIEATLVASLAQGGPLGTRDIVEKTGLRQPEVSVGMQVLRGRHWVEAEAVPREGKGRPMHRYRLVAAPAEMLAFYESEGKRTIDRFNEAILTVRRHFAASAMPAWREDMRRQSAAAHA